MKTILTTAILATAVADVVPAHADGFAYTGSPKQGEFFIRQTAMPQVPAWMNARAEAPRPAARPVRGGIGLRSP
ncbi:hypothetical protein [Bradyrhizobium liaoningense]|uniref:hypothetical protein n=1 Tax=Bradyrhizobium liaoningense TaxID=43992 RepID=UPI001BA74B2C|nr:hypothetical protein [Bradyrhizobium liaoningense]MBR0713474.1 hypothetical protein [Bradyrhizobium liaoningense]